MSAKEAEAKIEDEILMIEENLKSQSTDDEKRKVYLKMKEVY